MTSPLTYLYGGPNQGRIIPLTRSVVSTDTPTPATIRTLVSQPFPLVDGDTLLISVDGGATVAVLFEAVDFADIGTATALEVAAILGAQLGIHSQDDAGVVVLISATSGVASSLEVKGGQAQTALQFLTGLVTGTQGTYTYLFGYEQSGVFWDLLPGDSVGITQSGEFNDTKIVRLHGAAQFRTTPPGYMWRLRALTGVWREDLFDEAQFSPNYPQDYDLSDMVLNVSGLAGVQDLTVSLDFADVGGGVTAVSTELPAVWLDWIEFDETPADLFLANRVPGPEVIAVPATLRQVRGAIVNTTANAITAGSIEILVDGQIAYQSGAFVAPFDGPLSAVAAFTGPSNRDSTFVVDLTGYDLTGRPSETPIEVLVNALTAGPEVLADRWTFYLADTVAPQITSAVALSQTELLVTFTEPVVMTDELEGALRAASYGVTRRSAPSVPVTVISVVQNTVSSVVLTFNREASMGATYRIVAANIADLQGNMIDGKYLDFVAFRPVQPTGRSFSLWDKIPQLNKRADVSRDLRKFILCLQDQADILIDLSDKWPQVWQIDTAPERFLDVILIEMGNPFDFVLTVAEKRRLVGVLTTVYRQKGTPEGIINAVRFFLGIDVAISPQNVRENYWLVGFNNLGQNTFVAPPKGDPAWYSFFIDSQVILTDEDRITILTIADYMKPAHEHILGIREPGGIISAPNFWSLGFAALGVTTKVGV